MFNLKVVANSDSDMRSRLDQSKYLTVKPSEVRALHFIKFWFLGYTGLSEEIATGGRTQ